MEHFTPIGTVDIAPALAALKLREGLFAEDTWRQDYPGSAHPDSETIYLRMPKLDRSLPVEVLACIILHSLDVIDLRANYIGGFFKTVDAMAALVGKPIARAMIIRLKAGGVIKPHIDQGEYAEATDRYHLALTTNPRAWLKIGEETHHLRAGEVCGFNKHVLHEGANEGSEARDHMVVDFFKAAA